MPIASKARTAAVSKMDAGCNIWRNVSSWYVSQTPRDNWHTICESDVLFMLLYCFAIPAKKILFFQWASRYVGILQNKNMINAQIDLLIRQKKWCWVYKFCLFSQNISAPKNSLVLTLRNHDPHLVTILIPRFQSES